MYNYCLAQGRAYEAQETNLKILSVLPSSKGKCTILCILYEATFHHSIME
jgi:hypothetical protein